MRKAIWAWAAMASYFALTSAAQSAPPDDPSEWAPSHELAAKIDTLALKFALPDEFGPLAAYGRFYFGTAIGGRKVVMGTMISPVVLKEISPTTEAGFHVVPEKAAVGFADGGCMMVSVVFDVAEDQITQQHCNFELPRPLPNR